VGVHDEWKGEEADEYVHHGNGQEEEVMGAVEVWTFLDDHAEDEIAHERTTKDGQVEDDVAPAEQVNSE
jgi:hypothetical protein